MSSGQPHPRYETAGHARAISAGQQRVANTITELQRAVLRRYPFIADGSVEVIHDWLGGSHPKDTDWWETACGGGYWPCLGDRCAIL